jgi:hypothetical protein
MRSVWILALAASGCRGILGIDPPTRILDAGDGSDAACVPGPGDLDMCKLPAEEPLTLGAGHYVYDTSTGGGVLTRGTDTLRTSELTVVQADNSVVAVLSVASLVIERDASLSVIGAKPLVIVSASTIAIDGAIDAGSHIGVSDPARHIAETLTFGAGADRACGTSTGMDGVGATSTVGSGGGGGGGFQGAGGLGGSPVGMVARAVGGAHADPTVLRGGCPGGASGSAGSGALPPANENSTARGSAGGGAIRVVALQSITIAGSVSANGAGGAGAPLNSGCGGGGGGAGGHVIVEATSGTILGTITANGGGGGGGGGVNDFGKEGSDGRADAVQALGGEDSSSGCGVAGGPGSFGQPAGGGGASGSCGGGGGGGGGAGYIVVSAGITVDTMAKLSPAPVAP